MESHKFFKTREDLIQKFKKMETQKITGTSFDKLEIPSADIMLHRSKWYRLEEVPLNERKKFITPKASLGIQNINGRRIEIDLMMREDTNYICYNISFCDGQNIVYYLWDVAEFKMLSHNANSRIAISYKKYLENQCVFEDIGHLSTSAKSIINKPYTPEKFNEKFGLLQTKIIRF
ncbi:hypothetical protein E4K63_01930 [Allofrancisella inopinata]|uniref:Uncharacterized protein n=1 Tax=Allofrancisella inopinata TaxID=1085647 RepID=A0AAE6YGV2_9GAMM|nr:hypothetical protein [Allofrancisella inopinata]QIV95653.1 hypothetical protein E4K63_01930 [Allofrancisella inopinata]